MNLILLVHFLLFQNPSTPPLGEWLHKEDSSVIVFYSVEDKLYGKLISSKHPEYKKKQLIFRNFEVFDGRWKGEFYDVKNKRWVGAMLIVTDGFLVVHHEYGFIEKKFYLNKKP